MAKRSDGLLAQIRDGALDGDFALADVLRKCVALGGASGSEQLRDWARHELEGYQNGEDLPEYRRVGAPLYLHGSNLAYPDLHQQLSSFDLPEPIRNIHSATVDVTFGVAELQRLVDGGDKQLALQTPGLPEAVTWLNAQADYGTAVHALYYRVDKAKVVGVLDTIRTNLVALVAEIEASGVPDSAVPPEAVASQAVQVIIHKAKRSPINISTAVATGGGDVSAEQAVNPMPKESRIPGWLTGPWSFAVGSAAIAAVYLAIALPKSWWPL